HAVALGSVAYLPHRTQTETGLLRTMRILSRLYTLDSNAAFSLSAINPRIGPGARREQPQRGFARSAACELETATVVPLPLQRVGRRHRIGCVLKLTRASWSSKL